LYMMRLCIRDSNVRNRFVGSKLSIRTKNSIKKFEQKNLNKKSIPQFYGCYVYGLKTNRAVQV